MNHWARPSHLDRLEAARTPAALAELWPEALVLEVDEQGRFGAEDGRPVPLLDPGALLDDDVLLGRHDARVWFARPGPVTSGVPTRWRSTHRDHWDLVAAAVALVQWHSTQPLCEACSQATVPEPGGARRRCGSCGRLAFARHDPAVIVAVLDPADRLLLGRQASWPEGRFSILAGFVEPGESIEQAVWREVAEEAGVDLEAVRYVSSQPWPAPRSLMLGFVASAPDDGLAIDGVEIVEAAYWSREDLHGALARGTLTLPGEVSIARQLIEAWLADQLPPPRA